MQLVKQADSLTRSRPKTVFLTNHKTNSDAGGSWTTGTLQHQFHTSFDQIATSSASGVTPSFKDLVMNIN